MLPRLRNNGRTEGFEGCEEGRVEGERQKALSAARPIKAGGMPVETIAKYLSLSNDEVQGL